MLIIAYFRKKNTPYGHIKEIFESLLREMSHGFEIADAISFKEAGYCWILGHPELDSGSPLH